MDTRHAENDNLQPLQIEMARDLIAAWELAWWTAVRISHSTAPADREHGGMSEVEDVLHAATRWCGRSFDPEMVQFFAVHLTGIRLTLDRVISGEHQGVNDRVTALEEAHQPLRLRAPLRIGRRVFHP